MLYVGAYCDGKEKCGIKKKRKKSLIFACSMPSIPHFPVYLQKRNHRILSMRKYEEELLVVSREQMGGRCSLLKLRHLDVSAPFPEIVPGQFVQVLVKDSPATFLRRPISINDVDAERGELWLLVQEKGEGTRHLCALKAGDLLNVIYPLGHGFTMPQVDEKTLLVGGGVGVAPLLLFGRRMRDKGMEPTFLLGARTGDDLMEIDEFKKYGRVFVTTEDGSSGERGFVTQHSLLERERFDHVAVCGPKPMMLAVARYAKKVGTPCEVSLENLMACGLGACLCCVEKTVKGNVCACQDGPVFNIKELLWPI